MINRNDTESLCEMAGALERFAGQCVVMNPGKRVICGSFSMDVLSRETHKSKWKGKPFVFHVPSKEEVGSPIPVLKKT